MRPRQPAFALIAGAILLVSSAARADLPVPTLVGHVVDQAGVLEAKEHTELETRLREFERDHGSQVAVLTIRTLGHEPIERFSRRVAEHWSLGRAEHADGVLLTLAVNDRRMRIEVGTGLETALPDEFCQSVLSDTLKPHLKKREYYAAINDGLDEVLDRITQFGPKAKPAQPSQQPALATQPMRVAQTAPAPQRFVSGWELRQQLLLAAGLALWAISLYFTRRNVGFGVGAAGVVGLVTSLPLSIALAWVLPVALLVGWALWMFALLPSGNRSGYDSTSDYRSSDSSWSSSSSDSSSSSSDSSSSSSDSSFSGGGASDSW